jgi:hypothetical protein
MAERKLHPIYGTAPILGSNISPANDIQTPVPIPLALPSIVGRAGVEALRGNTGAKAGKAYRDAVTGTSNAIEAGANMGKAIGRGFNAAGQWVGENIYDQVQAYKDEAGIGNAVTPQAVQQAAPYLLPGQALGVAAKSQSPAVAPQVAAQAVPVAAPRAAPIASRDSAYANEVVNSLNQSTGGFNNAGFEPEARGPNLDDLNAIRERIIANGQRTGGTDMIALKAVDDIAKGRWQSYNTARGNEVQEAIGLGGVNQRNRATDVAQQQQDFTEKWRTMTDRDKLLATNDMAIAQDATAGPEERDAARARLMRLRLAPQANIDDIDEILTARGIMNGGVEQYAEGGEVDVEYEVEMDMPEAVPTGPMQMDSGDYIIPVEAMRFYGRKFFQDLINKAEDEG